MTEEELVEFCGGSYQVDLVRSYVTYYQQQKLDRNEQPYLNLANYHNDRRQLSQTIEGYMFDQIEAPRNWYGVWPGETIANTTPWQMCRILVLPKLPSRYVASQSHSVALAFVPNNWPLTSPAPGFISNVNQRIQMFLCGPRVKGKCKSGARTCGCCAHVATAAYICGVLAHNPGLFRSTWREINFVDAGSGQTEEHTADLFTGLSS